MSRRALPSRVAVAEFLPRHAAALYLGIGTTFLDKLIRTGALPAYKLGRRTVLVKREDLCALATAQPVSLKGRRPQ